MILDATNQKQAINEYAKMESNGFWGEKYFLKCFFFFFGLYFLCQKKCNLVEGGGGSGGGVVGGCLWQ